MIFLDVKTGYSTDKFSQIKSKIKKISTLFCGLRRIKLTVFLKKFSIKISMDYTRNWQSDFKIAHGKKKQC